MSETTNLAPDLVQRRADRRASQAAHDALHAKLEALGRLADLSTGQVSVGSRERAADAHQDPATSSQHWEAFTLATRLEATLPDLAGTALRERAQLVMVLLDAPGKARLTEHLRLARLLLA